MPTQNYLKKLQEREEQQLLREMSLARGADFCSNDYLGFARDAILQKKIHESLAGIESGSTGSRLLRGHSELSARLERRLAQFSEREEALFFPSGYQANLGVFSSLLTKDSLVFSDEYNHASIIDGIKLSGAEKKIFKHNSVEHLQFLLKENEKAGEKFIVIESLYSMRGDMAPLKTIVDLSLQYGAQLIIDETHATGVYGAGLSQRQDLHRHALVTVHSAGKAMGVSGAWVACDALIKEFMINFSRPFIYSTAPSPLVLQSILTSLEHWDIFGPVRSLECIDKAKDFVKQLKVFLVDDMILGDGPIVFLELKSNQVALSWANTLQSQGFDVRAIRYPTVPEHQAGLRISIHATHGPADLRSLVTAIRQLVTEC